LDINDEQSAAFLAALPPQLYRLEVLRSNVTILPTEGHRAVNIILTWLNKAGCLYMVVNTNKKAGVKVLVQVSTNTRTAFIQEFERIPLCFVVSIIVTEKQ
jgi:hypothetical protein